MNIVDKFFIMVLYSEDFVEKIIDVKFIIRFRLCKNFCIVMVIGNVDMIMEYLVVNIMIIINYLVLCFKKGWFNVNSIVIKLIMLCFCYFF